MILAFLSSSTLYTGHVNPVLNWINLYKSINHNVWALFYPPSILLLMSCIIDGMGDHSNHSLHHCIGLVPHRCLICTLCQMKKEKVVGPQPILLIAVLSEEHSCFVEKYTMRASQWENDFNTFLQPIVNISWFFGFLSNVGACWWYLVVTQ